MFVNWNYEQHKRNIGEKAREAQRARFVREVQEAKRESAPVRRPRRGR
jgi:hypothetical protein